MRKINRKSDEYKDSFIMFNVKQLLYLPFLQNIKIEKIYDQFSNIYLELKHCYFLNLTQSSNRHC